ncbi:MAG: cation diffusion facilitator family transporter [Christensenellaceae bacterium]|jgi:cation diffusion facilitator family transporter|nr:cation diffusion facilitator family transporter [Christensenellaceae bacterium]
MNKTDSRSKTAIRLGIIAISSNVVLCVLKFIIGILGHSITLIADAINNLTDTGASVVTLFGFKLAKRPADQQHPYGHARYEYVSGFLTAILIIIVGAVLGKTSFDRIIQPVELSVSPLTYIVLSFSLLVKCGLAIYYAIEARKLKSTTLKIAMFDSINDTLTTLAGAIAVLLFVTLRINLDGVFGLVVALWMIISGIRLFFIGLSPLIGHGDSECIKKISDKILSYANVLGVHDILIHNYGPSEKYASAHIEISNDTTLITAHRLADRIERDLRRDFDIYISIHIDPYEQSNPRISNINAIITEALTVLDDKLTIHDFHIEDCENSVHVYFDVILPYDSKLTKVNIIDAAKYALRNDDTNYSFIIDIDRS